MAERVNNNWLVFIDTNIWLDFYKRDGAESIKKFEALKRHRERLITTDQVLMEFLKNRQSAIANALKEVKRPETVKFPPFLREYSTASALDAGLKSARDRVGMMLNRGQKILSNPKRHDDVFRNFLSIFEMDSPYSLDRAHSKRDKMFVKAQERFFLGYPPGKESEITFGDALNWEWIVECAKACKNRSHIVIVSRDGDYGIRQEKSAILNDWLEREFKKRVGKERKILLTPRLTDALVRLDVEVSREDKRAEDSFLHQSAAHRDDSDDDVSTLDTADLVFFKAPMTAP